MPCALQAGSSPHLPLPCLQAQEEERQKQQRLAELKRKVKEELDAQVREKEVRRLAEERESQAYYRAEEEAVKEWEREEAAKREARLRAAERVKEERELQITQRKGIMEAAAAVRRQEEEALARQAYQDYKQKVEEEQASAPCRARGLDALFLLCVVC